MYLPKFQLEEIKESGPIEDTVKPDITPINAIQQKQGVDLAPDVAQILLSSFVMGIFGGPGAGKSSIISHFLLTHKLYGQKFQRVLFIGPTRYKGLVQDKYNTNPKLDVDWIYSHLKQIKAWRCRNLLIVFDDIISSLSKNTEEKLVDLFFNRRHLLKDNNYQGTISIIITSQKFNLVPVYMRGTMNCLVIFPLMKQQLSVLYSQTNICLPKKRFMDIFSQFKRHQHMFVNLQNNKAFNHQWVQI